MPGPHRFVPGAPKRFAQGVGLAFSGGALLSWVLGGHVLAIVLIAGLVVAAVLESVFAICLGCIVFAWLMRVGVIPESVCVECADITRRLAGAASSCRTTGAAPPRCADAPRLATRRRRRPRRR